MGPDELTATVKMRRGDLGGAISVIRKATPRPLEKIPFTLGPFQGHAIPTVNKFSSGEDIFWVMEIDLALVPENAPSIADIMEQWFGAEVNRG